MWQSKDLTPKDKWWGDSEAEPWRLPWSELTHTHTHTPVWRGCKTPPAHHTKARQGVFGSCQSSVFLLAPFLFSKQWTSASQARKSFPSAERWLLQKDMPPEFQTCQGHLQSCGKESEKPDYCKGWFQLHLTAGPVFICPGWQAKG